MALTATIHKAEIAISDVDRHYYATHALTLAKHPSETDERLMARLAAFVLHADERLELGRGLSSADEPDLWRKSLAGEIEQWIELGQPDESRIRKACGRAREVVVVGYNGRAFEVWWAKQAAALARHGNLRVIELPHGSTDALSPLLARTMRLQALVQEGELELSDEAATARVVPRVLKPGDRG